MIGLLLHNSIVLPGEWNEQCNRNEKTKSTMPNQTKKLKFSSVSNKFLHIQCEIKLKKNRRILFWIEDIACLVWLCLPDSGCSVHPNKLFCICPKWSKCIQLQSQIGPFSMAQILKSINHNQTNNGKMHCNRIKWWMQWTANWIQNCYKWKNHDRRNFLIVFMEKLCISGVVYLSFFPM